MAALLLRAKTNNVLQKGPKPVELEPMMTMTMLKMMLMMSMI